MNRGSTDAVNYAVQVSMDGADWHTVATSPSVSSGIDQFGFSATPAQFVRLAFTGPTAPNISEFTVAAAHS